MIAKLRWEENSYIPLPKVSPLPLKYLGILLTYVTKVLLLFWKSVLLSFGRFRDVEDVKEALRQETDVRDDEHDGSFITASPLDYHLFRQEITSKYPAYSPPAPLVPIEDQNNSILPPLSTHPSRQVSEENLQATALNMNSNGGSIFHQPVHIATPAPSPPPSPAGAGGKGGKKQNYQTNQNFPFLYPPLDDTSNTVGGKGNAELQDQLVGKRWEGGDVPASILEAGQLFASRMRMSRSIRQLWGVREKYIESERGWNGLPKDGHDPLRETSEQSLKDGQEDDQDNDQDNDDESETGLGQDYVDSDPGSQVESDSVGDPVMQKRLDTIDRFYVRITNVNGHDIY